MSKLSENSLEKEIRESYLAPSGNNDKGPMKIDGEEKSKNEYTNIEKKHKHEKDENREKTQSRVVSKEEERGKFSKETMRDKLSDAHIEEKNKERDQTKEKVRSFPKKMNKRSDKTGVYFNNEFN